MIEQLVYAIAAVIVVACVQSLYAWQGEIQNAPEVLLVVKTQAALFDRLASVVQSLHPYEVPGIIALPIVAGSESYLGWIDAEVVEE